MESVFYIQKQDYTYKVSIIPIEIYKDDPIILNRIKTIVSYNVNLGGRNKCVIFKVPNDKTSTIADLTMVKTSDGGCELSEKRVSGDKTIYLVQLGVQIIREYFKHIKVIKLLDTSKFTCPFPTGELRTIDMSKYEILFKGQSYYESRYNARIIDSSEHELYKQCIAHISDPIKKSPEFDFRNADLNDMFGPIYRRSKTWYEFLHIIKEKAGDELCYYVEPWYEHAIEEIFQHRRSSGFTWVFDVETTPRINYKKNSRKNGGVRTRKRERNNYKSSNEIADFYDVIYNRSYNPLI